MSLDPEGVLHAVLYMLAERALLPGPGDWAPIGVPPLAVETTGPMLGALRDCSYSVVQCK